MDTPSQVALSAFGRWLVAEVRNSTMTYWRKMLDGEMSGANAQLVQSMLAKMPAADQADLMPLFQKVIDTTLHYLLASLDEPSDISLHVQTPTGDVVSLRDVSDGLAGELHGNNGWIAQFGSKGG
jgi:hypothetical protein